MAGNVPGTPVQSTVPALAMVITTYERVEENGQTVDRATVTHTFFGDTEEECKGVMRAHSKTDQFFAGSLQGEWNGIKLTNSPAQIYRTGRLE